MLKIAAILSLFLIATLSQAQFRRSKREADHSNDYNAGGVWAQGVSCDSCGRECASACGTRHFRSCCFNYLRKKRPDTTKMRNFYNDGRQQMIPFFVENLPDDRFRWIPNENYGLFDDLDEIE